ncbi:hypothetical protein [robinz microvirus RP_42]|nr:hypothetical protein [robinz microvirus RP_42]
MKLNKISESHFDDIIYLLNDCYIRKSCRSCPLLHGKRTCMLDKSLLHQDAVYAASMVLLLECSHKRSTLILKNSLLQTSLKF